MPGSHTSAAALDLPIGRRTAADFTLLPMKITSLQMVGDQQRGGSYKITGTVKKKGVPSNIPTYARVRLYCDRDGSYVAQTWSDPATGAYEFRDVSPRYTYSAVAFDPAMNYRAVVGDRLTPTAL